MKKFDFQKYMPMLAFVATIVSILIGVFTLHHFYIESRREKEKQLIERAKAAIA